MPPRTLRFQVDMNSWSVPTGTLRQAHKRHFPLEITGSNELPLPPCSTLAAAICHRAESLPSVHSNSFAAGRIWHSHKGPLSVPEVEHTMQSFPLVTQSRVPIAGLETLPQWLQPTNPNTVPPSPTWDPSSHIKALSVEIGEHSQLLGAFNSGDLYPDLLQGWVWVSARALLSISLHNFFHLDTTRPPEYKGLQFPGIFLSSRGQKLGDWSDLI